MTKQTAIRINGADDITLSSPKGTTGLRYTDGKLYAGGKQLKLKAGPMAEIEQAISDYRPPRYEISEQAKRARAQYGTAERAWESEDADAYGVLATYEPEMLDAGTGAITVWIGREDLA